jgi:hypothetical protein
MICSPSGARYGDSMFLPGVRENQKKYVLIAMWDFFHIISQNKN